MSRKSLKTRDIIAKLEAIRISFNEEYKHAEKKIKEAESEYELAVKKYQKAKIKRRDYEALHMRSRKNSSSHSGSYQAGARSKYHHLKYGKKGRRRSSEKCRKPRKLKVRNVHNKRNGKKDKHDKHHKKHHKKQTSNQSTHSKISSFATKSVLSGLLKLFRKADKEGSGKYSSSSSSSSLSYIEPRRKPRKISLHSKEPDIGLLNLEELKLRKDQAKAKLAHARAHKEEIKYNYSKERYFLETKLRKSSIYRHNSNHSGRRHRSYRNNREL